MGSAREGDSVEPYETLDATSGHNRLPELRYDRRLSTDEIVTAWNGTSWCPTASTMLDLGSGIGRRLPARHLAEEARA